MPSTTRRSLLVTLGAAIGSLSGCTTDQSDNPPAGSLRFVNEHTVPHSVTMRTTGVGSEPGDEPGAVRGNPIVPPAQRDLTASTTIEPDETQTYENVFTGDVWYAVRFTVDGEMPEHDGGATTFSPAPSDGESGTILSGRISSSGEFSWVISSTENSGSFDR